MTKENKTQKLVEALQEVAETKQNEMKRGEAIVLKDVTYTVVEVIEKNRWHIKNVNAPFNSMIITDKDLVVGQEEEGSNK